MQGTCCLNMALYMLVLMARAGQFSDKMVYRMCGGNQVKIKDNCIMPVVVGHSGRATKKILALWTHFDTNWTFFTCMYSPLLLLFWILQAMDWVILRRLWINSVLLFCPMRSYNKIFVKMWGMNVQPQLWNLVLNLEGNWTDHATIPSPSYSCNGPTHAQLLKKRVRWLS